MTMQRFWSRVDKTAGPGWQGTPCWQWTGPPKGNGYGQVRVGSKILYAHVFAYEQSVGPVPAGKELDHRCRNRLCVNPQHLEPVTHQVNMSRGHWGRRTTCKHGHPYTPENTMMRLSRGLPIRLCRECVRARNRLASAKRRRQ